MTLLKTILINKVRRNYIASFEMLSDDYAILCLKDINNAIYWTYNIVSLCPKQDNEVRIMVYANNLNEAIKKAETVVKNTPDFDYSYDDILSKNGKWYKKRRKEKNDNREYKERYKKLVEFLQNLV